MLLWLGSLVPPVSDWARRYEFVQALQYGLYAFWIPVLIVAGAPWRRMGLASGESHVISDDGVLVAPVQPRLIDRIAFARGQVYGHRRTVAVTVVFMTFEIGWRVAPVVDYLVTHPWMTVLESFTLVASGLWLFFELIESPPLVPGVTRVYRIGVAAAVMWVGWVMAYLDGMSRNSWYHGFRHVAGRGISLAADQQLTAGMIWLVSAVVFMPIVFWNLIHWLQSEEDPSDELYRLVRREGTRGFFGTN